MSDSTSKPEILILSLSGWYGESDATTLAALAAKANLTKVKSEEDALDCIEDRPETIIAVDESLTNPRYDEVLQEIIRYVREGGNLIFAFGFPSTVHWDKVGGFFNKFGLPWTAGAYTKHDIKFNFNAVLPWDSIPPSGYPSKYYMKALYIHGAPPEQRIYRPRSSDLAAVVGAAVGRGYVTFIGDVNAEGTNEILLSLLGLSS